MKSTMKLTRERLAVDENMKELSDEDYLVQKAKETAVTDMYRSKAWTLTAKTLFPQNFDIQVSQEFVNIDEGCCINPFVLCSSKRILLRRRMVTPKKLPNISVHCTYIKIFQTNSVSELQFISFVTKVSVFRF